MFRIRYDQKYFHCLFLCWTGNQQASCVLVIWINPHISFYFSKWKILFYIFILFFIWPCKFCAVEPFSSKSTWLKKLERKTVTIMHISWVFKKLWPFFKFHPNISFEKQHENIFFILWFPISRHYKTFKPHYNFS